MFRFKKKQLFNKVQIEGLGSIENYKENYLTYLDEYIPIKKNYKKGLILAKNKKNVKFFPSSKFFICKNPKKKFEEILVKNINKNNFITNKEYISNKSKIAKNVIIGKNVSIEDYVQIKSGTIILDNTKIKKNVIIGENCVIGYEGMLKDPFAKITKLGSVMIDENSRIGVNTIIAKGALGKTIISKNTVIGNKCIIGHNVTIEDSVRISSNCTIAGSVHIKKNSFIGIGCNLKNGIHVGKNCKIAMGTSLNKNLKNDNFVHGINNKFFKYNYKT